MSIKIFPEKVSNIDSHKTRKKITQNTYASKELISKASHLKTTVEVANKELKKINLPYLKDTQVVFYSPEKIILQSDKEILKSKLKELHDQFVDKLRRCTLFSQLKKIEIIINYKDTTKNNTKTKHIDSKTARKALHKIKKEILKE